MRKTHLLGYAGFSGIFIFAISILLLHGRQPEISIRYDAMSYYVYGQLGWLLWAGLLGLGLGSLALAAGLWRIQKGAYARVGILCAGIWGTGLLIAAIFPTDPKGSWDQPPSTRGMIHFSAAIFAFIAITLAALFIAHAFIKDGHWKPVQKWIVPVTALTAISFILIMISIVSIFVSHGAPLYFGLTERLFFFMSLCWIGIASVGLLRSER
ncbi:DUF998 domain-containing protein [Paenibacillus humicus]|uniref:DUF998 domain-containing protein n=1 Tax=Paenibacillus humicus TaxID=412861 RepID=UPI003D2E9CDF